MKRKKVAKKVEPNKKSNTSEEKVFDIASPGKSMPSASGRPVIVSHKPNVSDPMVAPASQKSETEDKEEKSDTPSAGEGAEMVMAAPKKNRIEPLHTDITPDGPSIRLPKEEAEPMDVDGSLADEQDSPEEQPDNDQIEKDDLNKENDEVSDAAAEVTTKKQTQTEAAKQEAEAAKRQAEVDALINNRQFFVPINSVQKRRSMKLVIFLLVIVALLIGFLIAWDAGIIDLGIKAPTDFF